MSIPVSRLLCVVFIASVTTTPAMLRAADPLIRESRKVRVGAVEETWRLQWLGKAEPVCTPPDPETTTCPCSGFENGQKGQLALVRSLKGKEIDRLDLTPYFRGDYSVTQDGAVLQYKPWLATDYNDLNDPMLPSRIARRPTTTVMAIADYNQDGQATEFVLQTDTAPCGKRYGIAFGVTPESPKLHVFTSVAHPDEPLLLPLSMWDLLRESRGPRRMVTWECGDHGSDVETELEVEVTPQGFRATTRDFECDENDKRGKLREETQF